MQKNTCQMLKKRKKRITHFFLFFINGASVILFPNFNGLECIQKHAVLAAHYGESRSPESRGAQQKEVRNLPPYFIASWWSTSLGIIRIRSSLPSSTELTYFLGDLAHCLGPPWHDDPPLVLHTSVLLEHAHFKLSQTDSCSCEESLLAARTMVWEWNSTVRKKKKKKEDG